MRLNDQSRELLIKGLDATIRDLEATVAQATREIGQCREMRTELLNGSAPAVKQHKAEAVLQKAWTRKPVTEKPVTRRAVRVTQADIEEVADRAYAMLTPVPVLTAVYRDRLKLKRENIWWRALAVVAKKPGVVMGGISSSRTIRREPGVTA